MHYLTAIFRGLSTGFVLSLMLGTVFFSLIRNSISHGHRSGYYIATGVVLCDIIFIALAMLSQGFADFLGKYKSEVSVGGGITLVLIGLFIFFKSNPKVQEGQSFGTGNALYFIGNGFLLNVVNPVNFFSWLVISSYLSLNYNYNNGDKMIYFAACLLSIFLVECGIAYFAARLKTIISDRLLKRINQVSAIIFIAFGIKLILQL